MLTKQWKTERAGTGRYHVRVAGQRIPGEIMGGMGRWIVICKGAQWPTVYKTIKRAAEAIVRAECGT